MKSNLEQLRALDNNMEIHAVITNCDSWSVDTKEDLDVLKKIYNKYKGYPPNLDKIILWLDKNKNIKEINKNISRNDMDFKKYCKVNKNINFLK